MVAVRVPFLVKKLYYSLVWDIKSSEKEVYLTFDDGPTPGVTEEILAILDDFKAKATFFCIGRNVERHKEIYNTLISKGHAVGNHTYSHLKGWKSRNKVYYRDINLANSMIRSGMYRPPYGQIKRSQLKYLSKTYKIIMWDVMSYDFDKTIDAQRCYEYVIDNVKPGSIIVFHDSVKASRNVLQALPKVLSHLTNEGYKFPKIEIETLAE